jgi:uncharacterized membrane protein HdeD (DUF308 family)
MKRPNWITLSLGIILLIAGIISLIKGGSFGFGGIIPLCVGLSLCYLGFSRSRVALLVFGHTCVALGCFLVVWGIYLLPYCQPKLTHIIGRPLFWGLFSMMGGICAIYHGFCHCMKKQ